jgi:predicted Zn-dependent protease
VRERDVRVSHRKGFMVLVVLVAAALVAAGCGSKDKKDSSNKKSGSSSSLSGVKGKQVKEAEKGFDKQPKDVNACRSLAQSWIAYASPDAPKKAGDPIKVPKDRDKSLGKAADVLEKCMEIDPKDESTKQMLASTYMGLSKYDKAAPILHDIAKAHKNDANAWYAWGLAESSAGNPDKTIEAWQLFLKYAPKTDTRIAPTKQQIKALQTQVKATKK